MELVGLEFDFSNIHILLKNQHSRFLLDYKMQELQHLLTLQDLEALLDLYFLGDLEVTEDLYPLEDLEVLSTY
ncbi:hypothetical protein ANS015_02970 [Paraclostridium bifermentans]|nr:hypothetical protein ANS014_11730 [Paraclostridium bifermentans]GKZ05414.1 hypothetical protein ANS015_02970 [Paraclostridium bifermentans]